MDVRVTIFRSVWDSLGAETSNHPEAAAPLTRPRTMIHAFSVDVTRQPVAHVAFGIAFPYAAQGIPRRGGRDRHHRVCRIWIAGHPMKAV